jgi:WD40 repeat protein
MRYLTSILTVAVVLLLSGPFTMASPITELPYLDGNHLTLYRLGANKTERLSIPASRILDHSTHHGALLAFERTTNLGGTLTAVNTKTWESRIIAHDVIRAKLAPTTNAIVAWFKGNTIELLDTDGEFLLNIADNATAPIFSHDGRLLAYQKLAVAYTDDEQDSFEYAQGLAIYDLKRNTEVLVTDHPEDFAPIGFSPDMRVLFFNSTRAYEDDPVSHVASVWAVSIASGAITRLTNRSSVDARRGIHVPIVDENAIWTSDRRTAISATDSESGVWRHTFNIRGDAVMSERLADGNSPIWVERDHKFATTVLDNGRATLRTWSMSKIKGGQ